MSYNLWGRLTYMLSPQFDIYEQVSKVIYGKVADIGSGTGFGTHLLVRNSDHVTGYEVDAAAMKFATRAFSNGKIKFISANICGAMPKNEYEFVTMIDVIEHIEEDHIAVYNCSNMLVYGGTFICSTPNRLSRYRKSDYHAREYSPDELKNLLELVFETVKIVDHQLNPIETEYSNPIIGICQ